MATLSIEQLPDEDVTVIEGIRYANDLLRALSKGGIARGPFLIDTRNSKVIIRTISRWPERFMLFGRRRDVLDYAHTMKLSRHDWYHGISAQHVVGFDPTQFDTVVVGPLDEQAREALEVWRQRGAMRVERR